MADPEQRWPDNAPGPWFVDLECIVCTACSDAAPDHFRLAASEDHDVVYRQPATPDEEAACEAARLACPVDAIGRVSRLGRTG